MTSDVLIVGGGPAGAIAATLLARKGLRVTLADGVAPARHKIGDHLPAVAARLLRKLNIDLPPAAHLRVGGILSSWGAENLVATDAINDPDGPGWLLDRATFDSGLRAHACAAGANVIASNVTAIDRDTVWRARLRNGAMVAARWVIDATGRRSSIARRLGAARIHDTRMAAVYWIGSGSLTRLDRTLVEARPNGWWYAARLPRDRQVAGFHVLAKDASRLIRHPEIWLRELDDTRHISPRFPSPSFETPLRSTEAGGSRLDRFAGASWLACGDAALAFDPISGRGMHFAIHSGMLAAECILDGRVAAPDDYAERLNGIRRIYAQRQQEIYRTESRWNARPFWSAMTSSVDAHRALGPRIAMDISGLSEGEALDERS